MLDRYRIIGNTFERLRDEHIYPNLFNILRGDHMAGTVGCGRRTRCINFNAFVPLVLGSTRRLGSNAKSACPWRRRVSIHFALKTYLRTNLADEIYANFKDWATPQHSPDRRGVMMLDEEARLLITHVMEQFERQGGIEMWEYSARVIVRDTADRRAVLGSFQIRIHRK